LDRPALPVRGSVEKPWQVRLLRGPYFRELRRRGADHGSPEGRHRLRRRPVELRQIADPRGISRQSSGRVPMGARLCSCRAVSYSDRRKENTLMRRTCLISILGLLVLAGLTAAPVRAKHVPTVTEFPTPTPN